MIIEIQKYLFVIIMGIFFALLQSCYFFQLEIWLTAAYPSFLTITLGWILGSVVGLRLFQSGRFGSCRTWLFISVLAYYLTISLLKIFPFQMALLPVYGIFIGASGVLAGRFFVEFRFIYKTSARLFFMENNGFVVGWILGFLGFVWSGNTFNFIAPIMVGALCFILLLINSRPITIRD